MRKREEKNQLRKRNKIEKMEKEGKSIVGEREIQNSEQIWRWKWSEKRKKEKKNNKNLNENR